MDVDIRATLKSLDPLTSIGPATAARIVNISHHGLKLRVDRFYLTGTLVQIMAESNIFLGRVRYCLESESGFYVGVQLHEGFS